MGSLVVVLDRQNLHYCNRLHRQRREEKGAAVAISMGGGEHGFFCACDGCKATAPSCQSGRHMLQVQGTDLLCPVKWLTASCHQGKFEAYAGLFRFHCANASWSLVHRGPAGATPGTSSTPFTWHHQSGNCASALFKQSNKQVATQPTVAVMAGMSAQLVKMAAKAKAKVGAAHPEVQLQGTRILQFSIAAEAVRGRLLMRMECSYWVGR